MLLLLSNLRKERKIAFVGGSDLAKQREQLGDDCVERFDFCFSENGATAFKAGEQISAESFLEYLGEERYTKLVNFLLKYIADLDIPKKRGTFLELRNAMLNVSPIGRNCSYEERLEFEQFDKVHRVRESLCSALKEKFASFGLKFSIGGQISIDIFPTGWDKTYCLRYLKEFKTVYFFGDMTHPGGNDYEIFSDPRVTGFTTRGPEDTAKQLRSLFNLE